MLSLQTCAGIELDTIKRMVTIIVTLWYFRWRKIFQSTLSRYLFCRLGMAIAKVNDLFHYSALFMREKEVGLRLFKMRWLIDWLHWVKLLSNSVTVCQIHYLKWYWWPAIAMSWQFLTGRPDHFVLTTISKQLALMLVVTRRLSRENFRIISAWILQEYSPWFRFTKIQ